MKTLQCGRTRRESPSCELHLSQCTFQGSTSSLHMCIVAKHMIAKKLRYAFIYYCKVYLYLLLINKLLVCNNFSLSCIVICSGMRLSTIRCC